VGRAVLTILKLINRCDIAGVIRELGMNDVRRSSQTAARRTTRTSVRTLGLHIVWITAIEGETMPGCTTADKRTTFERSTRPAALRCQSLGTSAAPGRLQTHGVRGLWPVYQRRLCVVDRQPTTHVTLEEVLDHYLAALVPRGRSGPSIRPPIMKALCPNRTKRGTAVQCRAPPPGAFQVAQGIRGLCRSMISQPAMRQSLYDRGAGDRAHSHKA